MVRAKLLSSAGPYLEAWIEVEGQRLCVMDEFSVCAETSPAPGEVFDFEFSPFLDDDEDWDSMFAGNPESRLGLEQLDGWRYRAFGRVIGVNPVVVDCGLFQLEDVVHSSDPRLIGATLAFTVTRLGGYAQI